MKKIILLFLVLTNFMQSQELGFTSISITALSQNNININVQATSNCGAYLSNEVIIDQSEITLKICYIFCGAGIILNPENDFQINLPNNGAYNINIVAYESTDPNNICNYNNIQDSANLSFNMPLNQPITLKNSSFSENQNNFFYPNPSNGIIKSENFIGRSVSFYDNLGRKIKQVTNLQQPIIDMSEFDNGIYFIETEFKNIKQIKKIILKK